MWPKVSIVIPVYNGADYVGEAIQSALGQTYRSIEVLVINDGSDDDDATARACKIYGDQIRYFEKPNGGVASALNYGAQQMRGEYFSWLSHDDRFFRVKTEMQINVLESANNQSLVLLSDWETIDATGRQIGLRESPPLTFESDAGGHGWQCLLRGHMNGSTMMFHRDHFARHGPFDEDLLFAQDYDLWMRMLSSEAFLRIPVPLVSRRHHDAQLSHSPGALPEGTAIWRKILSTTPEIIQVKLHGSRQRFLAHMGEFLRTHYPAAAAWAREQAQQASTASRVAVVMSFRELSTAVLRSLEAARRQDYPDLEIIAASYGTQEQLDALRTATAGAEGIRLLSCPASNAARAWNSCIERATGEYVAFLRPGDVWPADKIARQVARMQSEGAVFSHTAHDDGPAPSSGPASMALSTVMLHRSLFLRGARFPELPPEHSILHFLASLATDIRPLEISDALCRFPAPTPEEPTGDPGRVAALVDFIAGCCVEPRLLPELEQLRAAFREVVHATEPPTDVASG